MLIVELCWRDLFVEIVNKIWTACPLTSSRNFFVFITAVNVQCSFSSERKRLEAFRHLAFWSGSGWKTQPSFQLILWFPCRVQSSASSAFPNARGSSPAEKCGFPLSICALSFSFICFPLYLNHVSSISLYYPLVISIVPPLWWVSLLGQIYTSTEAWIKRL